ncbi:MAG: CBS domain-containing protein [Candidatus Aenigmarchaeota archaeon]|nr:CBS domain-containing protein [Candidatus Aenigmarchaeota archaeon]
MARLTCFLKDEMNRDVTLVNPDKSVRYAGQILKAVGIGCMLVIDKGKVVGILTERDITQKVVADGLDPEKTRVRDIMSKNIISLSKDDTIDDAVDLMEQKGIKKLPIMENGKILGIVTMTDLLRKLREREK